MSRFGLRASDEVTVTNRSGRRTGLRIAQPSGAFAVTYAWDAAGHWSIVGGTTTPSPTATPRPTPVARLGHCPPPSPCPATAT